MPVTTCHTQKQVKQNATNNLIQCFISAFNALSDGVLRIAELHLDPAVGWLRILNSQSESYK